MRELLCRSSAGEAAAANDLIAPMIAEAQAHPALRHPWLQAFAAAALPDPAWAVCDFARNFHGYAQWFPRYLQTVIQRLPDPRHRAILADNLAEERGQLDEDDHAALRQVGIDPAQVAGIPHSRLFRRFCHALGIANDELAVPRPAAVRWRERLLAVLQQGSPAFCVGALGLGTEGVIRAIYHQIIAGIQRASALSRSDYVFFELHCLIDDEHYRAMLTISADFAATPAGRGGLRAGMRTALDLRAAFWTELHRRAVQREQQA